GVAFPDAAERAAAGRAGVRGRCPVRGRVVVRRARRRGRRVGRRARVAAGGRADRGRGTASGAVGDAGVPAVAGVVPAGLVAGPRAVGGGGGAPGGHLAVRPGGDGVVVRRGAGRVRQGPVAGGAARDAAVHADRLLVRPAPGLPVPGADAGRAR